MRKLSEKMATKSFDEMMVIDTPEAARNLEAAYYAALERGPLNLDHIDVDEELRRGRESRRNNPNWGKELIETARKRMEERGITIEDLMEEEEE
jgi:hypothetical protein